MSKYNVTWKENGRLKLLIIVGTRPEIIRLAAVIKKCRKYFDTILAHTGQNYDYNLNGVFFHDPELDDPKVYLNAVGLLQAVDTAVEMVRDEVNGGAIPVPDYVDENVSDKVVKIIQSYTGVVNKMVWRKY